MTARARPSVLVQLAAVFRKEVQQTVRDRRIMFMLLVAPLIQTSSSASRWTSRWTGSRRWWSTRTGAETSREDVRRLLADGTLRPAGEAASAERERGHRRRGAAAALVFRRRAEADRLSGRGQEVQVLLDGTDPNRAPSCRARSRYFAERGERLARERVEATGAAPPRSSRPVPRVAFNPG